MNETEKVLFEMLAGIKKLTSKNTKPKGEFKPREKKGPKPKAPKAPKVAKAVVPKGAKKALFRDEKKGGAKHLSPLSTKKSPDALKATGDAAKKKKNSPLGRPTGPREGGLNDKKTIKGDLEKIATMDSIEKLANSLRKHASESTNLKTAHKQTMNAMSDGLMQISRSYKRV